MSRANLLFGGISLIAIAAAMLLALGQEHDNTSCSIATAGVATSTEGLMEGLGVSSIITKGVLVANTPAICGHVADIL